MAFGNNLNFFGERDMRDMKRDIELDRRDIMSRCDIISELCHANYLLTRF